MATFITTLHFTEQGIKAVRNSCDRAAAFKAVAQKLGVKVIGEYPGAVRFPPIPGPWGCLRPGHSLTE